ncbi:MAG: ATP-dependent RecD-like DNA helicase [Verrucomicrobiales bacterium]
MHIRAPAPACGTMADGDPAAAPESISGSIERVTFFTEETGYCVLKVRMRGRLQPVTVVGYAPSVAPGEDIEARGAWVSVPEYGRQFKAAELATAPPESLEGIERYLGSGLVEGVGPAYAKRLVKKFGTEIFEVIDKYSKRLEEVEGIGRKRREEIKKGWEKAQGTREIMTFLFKHGLSGNQAGKIYREYGANAVEVLKSNPYQLAKDIRGIGFKMADQIAAKFGVSGAAPERVRAGLRHALDEAADNGHCALPEGDLVAAAAKLLGVAEGEAAAPLAAMVAANDLAREDIGGAALIYLPHLLAAEIGTADRLKDLAARPPSYPNIDVGKALAWCEAQIGYPLAEAQRAAVREALARRAAIITGGPGTGKTTVLNAILKILLAKKVAAVLCAPTGRAAKRLSESTGLEASTVHRLLEYQPARGPGRNEKRPLEGDLFVMDETSMVDAPLMHAFLRALPVGAHLLLVGDVDQLPSVGPGAILGDAIGSGVVLVVRLSEIFRQAAASRIVTAAHEINAGRLPDLDPPQGAASDFYFVERPSPEASLEALIDFAARRIPGRFGFEPINEIQVLTPMHRGTLGTQSLNAQLQAALNPPGEFKIEIERGGTVLREGDKVIQTLNNYEKDAYNGDIGRILKIEGDPLKLSVRFDDGRVADYASDELDELRLAYAITIHKSQGSEFPCVIIPATTQHFILLQRNLIYTGITRGRRLVVLVGERKALEIAVRNNDTRKRFTALKERLRSL